MCWSVVVEVYDNTLCLDMRKRLQCWENMEVVALVKIQCLAK